MRHVAFFFVLAAGCLGNVESASLDAGRPASSDSGSNVGDNVDGGSPPSGDAALPVSMAGSACGMQLGTSPAIFCDTFDTPSTTITRSGQLDVNVWGVARGLGGGTNFGQNEYGMFNATTLQKCDGSSPTVTSPNDVIVCNGQLREATNDNNDGGFDDGDVSTLAMYPKQPFDFTGRTGTVSFDVSNDSTGGHAVWPEFWLTDLPVPLPHNHFDSWQSLSQDGMGISFSAVAPVGSNGACPNPTGNDDLTKMRWTVNDVSVVRDYVLDNTDGFNGPPIGPGWLSLTRLDCVTKSSGPGDMNHVELRISKSQIDVYATDAGVKASPSTLKHLATISSLPGKPFLTLTRGLIWLEDVHYNADKETLGLGTAPSTSQRQHTFSWDNVAFDGPFTDRDFAYDADDNNASAPNGAISLGRFSQANQTSTWTVPSLPANPRAAAVRVLFNFFGTWNPLPKVLTVVVNGHSHTSPWPYPDNGTEPGTTVEIGSWRTYAVTVAMTDLVAGTNTVELGTDQPMVFANVDIVLAGVPGGIPILPGANTGYPTDNAFASSGSDVVSTFAQTQTYLNQYCGSCHVQGSANGAFDTYADLMKTGYVVPGNANLSQLCSVIQVDTAPLPLNLPGSVAQDICAWISKGALSN